MAHWKPCLNVWQDLQENLSDAQLSNFVIISSIKIQIFSVHDTDFCGSLQQFAASYLFIL